MNLFSNVLKKYRDYVLFNKNLLISGTAGFFASAVVSQLYGIVDENVATNSLVALVTEYAVYIPLFSYMFYRDNKYWYVDESGKRDSRKVWNDVKKLLAAFSVSEIIYSVTRGYTHYQILVTGVEPYQASMIASIISWSVFFICINLGVKLVRLFKKNIQEG